ncbi:MAG: beta-lactamase family protein [Clostridia bacterium]|nr:beta-lactamase family protein [Clostridia bacterium]
MNTENLKNILLKGLEQGAYPCCAAAVGRGNEVFFRFSAGHRALFPEKLPLTENTLFDMASLTKLMGTTMACLRMLEEGKIALNDKISKYFSQCFGKEDITVFMLMTHTSGISAHMPLYLDKDSVDAVSAILSKPLAYPTGTKTVYSCMGYILLGKILEKIEGKTLDKIVKERVFVPLGMENSFYNPPADAICAATERDIFTGEMVCGVVHDENARFLKGISGNAGMFCTVNDTVRFAKMLSQRGAGYLDEKTFSLAVTDYTPDFDESRGLGFQLYGGKPFPGGSKMPMGSYGHTGFTGTSLFVDNKTGVYAILLTNRVHPTRENGLLYPIRREFYDTVFSEI